MKKKLVFIPLTAVKINQKKNPRAFYIHFYRFYKCLCWMQRYIYSVMLRTGDSQLLLLQVMESPLLL